MSFFARIFFNWRSVLHKVPATKKRDINAIVSSCECAHVKDLRLNCLFLQDVFLALIDYWLIVMGAVDQAAFLRFRKRPKRWNAKSWRMILRCFPLSFSSRIT